MKSRMIVLASLVSLALASLAFADDGGKKPNKSIEVIPVTFVGLAPGCAPSPPGSNIVTSAWLNGLGMPDDLVSPSTPNNTDPHMGLLLSKDGPTTDCSAASADITNVTGITLTQIGFDINNGTHCGAGAPRFNVQASDGFHFLGGCSNGTPTPAPQDPTAWTRVRIDPTSAAQAFPPIAAGATIVSISIIFDEGTDVAPLPAPGLAVIDNIDINNTLVGAGKTESAKKTEKPDKKGGGGN